VVRHLLIVASTWCATLNGEPVGGESSAHKPTTRVHCGYESAFMIYDLPQVKSPFKSWPLAALGSVIALVIAIEITIVHGYSQPSANTDKVSQSQETIFATEDIPRSILNMEPAERGFLICAGEAFLGPYELGREALAAAREQSDNSAGT
jgi:hypothetical protein